MRGKRKRIQEIKIKIGGLRSLRLSAPDTNINVFRLIVLTFLLLLPLNRQLNRLILVSFYSAMTIELVLAELLCCDCERVFFNSLYFMFLHFILYCGQL